MDAADYYSGLVADAYAQLKSTSFAPQPYADFVRASGQPGLEIGCGDGEPLLDLCADGLDVDGVDAAEDMVQRCRANAARRGLDVAVHHQRVEDLALERRYASIYFAGPTFNLIPDDAIALRALRAIRDHLTGEGTALIPLWVPGPTPESALGTVRESEAAGVTLRFIPVTESYDTGLRTRTTTTRYQRETSAGVETVDREWILHWHTPDGFRQLCAEAGLTIVRLADDDTGGEPTGTASSSFTATLRRTNPAGS